MPSIALLTDSTSDMNAEALREARAEMVPLQVHFGSETLRDYVDISPDEFLARLESSEALPRTSQPSPAAFSEAFDEALENHDQVLALTVSSKLSGTYQSARLGAAASQHERIRIVDTLGASVSLQMQVRRARALIDAGMDIDTIVTALDEERDQYHLLFFADTLTYLQKGGRIGKAGQLLGTLLKVKPILTCSDGEVALFERTRSRPRAIEGLISYALGLDDVQRAAVLHDGTEDDDVSHLLDALSALVPRDEIIVNRYGATVATHVGPRALGICLFTNG